MPNSLTQIFCCHRSHSLAFDTPAEYRMDVRKYGVRHVLWYGCVTTDLLTSEGASEREPLRLAASFLLRISTEVCHLLPKKYNAHGEC